MEKFMIDDINHFPAHTIPEFMKVLAVFNEALMETIKNLHTATFRAEFEKVASDLLEDVSWFTNNIKNWEAEILTTEQQTELQSLQQKFEESKALISNTETALRHYH
jgi:hypothetical protein